MDNMCSLCWMGGALFLIPAMPLKSSDALDVSGQPRHLWFQTNFAGHQGGVLAGWGLLSYL